MGEELKSATRQARWIGGRKGKNIPTEEDRGAVLGRLAASGSGQAEWQLSMLKVWSQRQINHQKDLRGLTETGAKGIKHQCRMGKVVGDGRLECSCRVGVDDDAAKLNGDS